ncbi:ATPase of the AAA class, partial [Coemansia sp. RSA 25]
TVGFSGADLKNLAREAAMLALRQDLDAVQVGMTHYRMAMGVVQPSLKSDLMEYYTRMQAEYS